MRSTRNLTCIFVLLSATFGCEAQTSPLIVGVGTGDCAKLNAGQLELRAVRVDHDEPVEVPNTDGETSQQVVEFTLKSTLPFRGHQGDDALIVGETIVFGRGSQTSSFELDFTAYHPDRLPSVSQIDYARVPAGPLTPPADNMRCPIDFQFSVDTLPSADGM